MTTLTQPISTAIDILRYATDHELHEERRTDVVQARMNLFREAAVSDLATPFNEWGGIVDNLVDSDAAFDFREAEGRLASAERDRQILLTGVAVGAGTVAGAALGGLALRQAHRKGWLSRPLQGLNRKFILAAVRRMYGKAAKDAIRLTMAGKVNAIFDAGTNKYIGEGYADFTKEGLIFTAYRGFTNEAGQKFSIPLDAVTGIECTLDRKGTVKWAALRVTEYTPLD